MKITFGSPDESIKDANLEELVHAIITPDGCGTQKKLMILNELINRYHSIVIQKEIVQRIKV